jgi:predicted MFS family arabinose efflux permease
MNAVRKAWLVVIGSIMGLIVGNGPIMQFTFGVFLKPIVEEFGWARSTVSLALIVALSMTAICVPFAGRLIDRYGIRWVVGPAIALFSLSLACLALFATSPLSFVILYAVMGVAAAGQTPLPYAKAISAWFDGRRGLALGIAMAGVGAGAALVPQYAQYLVALKGWRMAYLGLALLVFVVAMPAVLFLVRMPSRADVLSGVHHEGMTAAEALRSPMFWSLAAAFFAVAAATNGTIAHLVPILTDQGINASVAASSLALAGLALIAGRLIAGFCLDRVFAPYVAAIFFVLPLGGLSLLYASSDQVAASIAVVMIGLGLGAEVDLIAFLLTRYLGQRSFGEIYGYLFAIFVLGSGAGPYAMGISFDRTGSYRPCLLLFMAILLFAIILVLRFGPYTYPARVVGSVRPEAAPAVP